MDLLDRRHWKLRTVRAIRQGQNGLIRYPFVSPLFRVDIGSRTARSHWVQAGYLDTVVRIGGVSQTHTVQTTFLRLFDSQFVWVPEGISTYWLKMRPRIWLKEVKLTISEFVGDASTDEFAQLRGQLDRIEIKVDRLNP